MRTTRKRRIGKRDSGAAMVTVMTMIAMTVAVLGVMMATGVQRSFMARKLGDRIRAQAIAEAGANRAYVILSTNFNARLSDAAFPRTSYGNGAYDVGVKAVGDSLVVICSTGTYAAAHEVVILDICKYTDPIAGGGGGPGGQYECAILAGGTVTWTGSGVFSTNGLAHGNGTFKQAGSGELNANISSSVEIDLNGNSGFVNGDAYAPKITGKTDKILGAQHVQSVPVKKIPSIELAPYYNYALARSQVFTGPVTISADSAPAGGIMWVNGSLDISGNITLTGCFIATGDIKIAGNGQHNKVANYPGFVSRDGSIKFPGSKNLQGLLYAPVGGIEMNGGGSLTGCIICGGDFKKSGNSTVFNVVRTAPTPPGGGSGPGENGIVAPLAWQK